MGVPHMRPTANAPGIERSRRYRVGTHEATQYQTVTCLVLDAERRASPRRSNTPAAEILSGARPRSGGSERPTRRRSRDSVLTCVVVRGQRKVQFQASHVPSERLYARRLGAASGAIVKCCGFGNEGCSGGNPLIRRSVVVIVVVCEADAGLEPHAVEHVGDEVVAR
jgi:hypothetical protein